MSIPNDEIFDVLESIRRHPGLLAATAGDDDGPDRRALLEAALEGPTEAASPRELFDTYLERGEIAAARELARRMRRRPGERGDDDWTVETRHESMAEAARWEQKLERAIRRVRGRSLLVRGSEQADARELLRRVERLCDDNSAKRDRPGWVVRRLKGLDVELATAIDAERERLYDRLTDLMEASSDDPDETLEQALERLEDALRSPEGLPTARRLVGLASIGVADADDVAERLHKAELEVLELDDEESERTIELTEALPGAETELVPERVAEGLEVFFELSETPDPVSDTDDGVFLRLRLDTPRVPALRSEPLYLAIPATPDGEAVSSLIADRPDDGLTVVYRPGVHRTSVRESHDLERDVPHLDDLDWLRIVEAPGGAREQAFQQIVLPRAPQAIVEPWQVGGPVAREMFHGRDGLVDRLEQPRGGTVLFGGRMMGKSSILDQLQRDVERRGGPGTNRRAIRVSSAGAELFFPLVDQLAELFADRASEIREEAQRLETTADQSTDERREALETRREMVGELVRSYLRRDDSELTILVDEADRFAARDAERPVDASLAWQLRDLEFDHAEQLRIVFAGFQSIHEQTVSENGAFANWFGAREVGPLARSEARALVRETFADFGYQFTSAAGPGRIVEFTGRHPVLLHEFGSRLMERMERRRGDAVRDETLRVELGDIEAVVRDESMRERVCQVLRLNLDEASRLKLMVYLLIETCGVDEEAGGWTLEEFRLEDLRATLTHWYGDKFNEYFDDRSIAALIARLEALGLIERRGDRYEFVHRTYARMLADRPEFDRELEELLERGTTPAESEKRRFPTLPAEQLERVRYAGDAGTHRLFIGLPGTMRSTIARRLYAPTGPDPETCLLSPLAGATPGEIREKLADRLDVEGVSSVDEVMAAADRRTLVLDDAGGLVAEGTLERLAEQLDGTDRRLVASGGVRLARAFVDRLFVLDVDPVRLERLRAADIRKWGRERTGATLVFDERTSERLREMTSGYFPLVEEFATFVERGSGDETEYLPEAADLERFGDQRLAAETIEAALLADLDDASRRVLAALYRTAADEDYWRVEPEVLRELWMPRLTEETDVSEQRIQDVLEVLRMLDLVGVANDPADGTYVLEPEGPLARVFVAF